MCIYTSYMNISIYINMHTHIHIYIHRHISMNIYIYIYYEYTCMYIYIYKYIYTYVYIFINAYMCIHKHIYVNISIYLYACGCIYWVDYKHIHALTHTHTHIRREPDLHREDGVPNHSSAVTCQEHNPVCVPLYFATTRPVRLCVYMGVCEEEGATGGGGWEIRYSPIYLGCGDTCKGVTNIYTPSYI